MLKAMSAKEIPTGGKIISAGNSVEYKTGDWRSMKPIRDIKKCTNCMICWMYCPENCIVAKNGKLQKIDLDFCKGCGICATECPFKAIEMVEEGGNNVQK